MADKTERLKLIIETDDKASAGLKGVGKEALKLGDDLDDTRSKGQKVADALSAIADAAKTEFGKAEEAAEELAKALGPEFAAKVGQNGLDTLVSDLKQTGLTYDEIKADADALAVAIKHVDDVGSQLNGAQSGAKDLADDIEKVGDNAKVAEGQIDGLGGKARKIGDDFDHVSGRADNTRSVVANFTGNAASSLPGVSAAFGPLNQAIGQFGEYAAEGNIGMKNFVAAGAGLAVVSLALGAVSEHMKIVAATKAFHRDRVDDWTDAIREADTALEALQEKLQEDEKVEFIVGGEVRDAVDSLAELNITIGEYTDLVAGGADAVTHWKNNHIDNIPGVRAEWDRLGETFTTDKNILTAMLGSSEPQVRAFAETMLSLTQATDDYADSVASSQDRAEVFGDALGVVTDEMIATGRSTRDTRDDLDNFRQAADGAEEALNRQSEAARDSAEKTRWLEQAIKDADAAYSELTGSLSAKEAWLNLNQSIDEFTWKMAEGKLSTREQQQALIDIQQDLTEYTLGLEGVPAAKKTEIYAAIAKGDIEEAKRLIDEATRDRTVTIAVNSKLDAGAKWLMNTGGQVVAAPTPGTKVFSKPLELAEGGVVKARPGGTLAVIGEAGEDEFVIPKSKMGQYAGGGTQVNQYFLGPGITNQSHVGAVKEQTRRRSS